jgi:hypothetical protein
MHRRQVIILTALAVGTLFVVGLFIHSWLGGVFLLVTAAILASITRAVWGQIPAKGRPLRIVIIAAIAIGGLVKLITG